MLICGQVMLSDEGVRDFSTPVLIGQIYRLPSLQRAMPAFRPSPPLQHIRSLQWKLVMKDRNTPDEWGGQQVEWLEDMSLERLIGEHGQISLEAARGRGQRHHDDENTRVILGLPKTSIYMYTSRSTHRG